MSAGQIIKFKISRMDGLGQGVSKESEKITFIPKTLIGDEGEAVITAERKGVAFARLLKLTKQADNRQESPCPHFEKCPSCHFLHTDYPSELQIKKESLERLLRKHPIPSIKVIGAIRRLNYRNRIQLHYDVDQKKIGMLDVATQSLVEIPQCSIGNDTIMKEAQRLYQDSEWLKEVPATQRRGHVELYSINNELKVSWNRPYADGGFTQVFEEMNQILKLEISKWSKGKIPRETLDLFAGNGNMSEALNYSKRLCVDMYPTGPGEDFLSQDLYDLKALSRVSSELKTRKLSPQVLLLDPPRSGLKNLQQWLERLKPQSVAYVSCDPNTLARDVADLKDYSIEQVFLIDFFPSSFHFETMIFLERNS